MTKNGDFISGLNSLQYLVHNPKSATTCSVDLVEGGRAEGRGVRLGISECGLRIVRPGFRWQRAENMEFRSRTRRRPMGRDFRLRQATPWQDAAAKDAARSELRRAEVLIENRVPIDMSNREKIIDFGLICDKRITLIRAVPLLSNRTFYSHLLCGTMADPLKLNPFYSLLKLLKDRIPPFFIRHSSFVIPNRRSYCGTWCNPDITAGIILLCVPSGCALL